MLENTQSTIEARFDALEEKVRQSLDKLEDTAETQDQTLPAPYPVWINVSERQTKPREKASILDLMHGDVTVQSARSRGNKD